MTPVDQQILACPERGDGHSADGVAGDCMRAALATILDLPYDDVPHFVHYGDGRAVQEINDTDPYLAEYGALWFRRCRRWLRERGLDIGSWELDAATVHYRMDGSVSSVYLPRGLAIRTEEGHPWSGHVLLSGRSPRGSFDHVVVATYEWWPTRKPGRVRPVIRPTFDPHPSRAGILTAKAFDSIILPYDPPPPEVDE